MDLCVLVFQSLEGYSCAGVCVIGSGFGITWSRCVVSSQIVFVRCSCDPDEWVKIAPETCTATVVQKEIKNIVYI
jgi:hypothetical protein